MRKILYSFFLIAILFASAAVFISPASAGPEMILIQEWPGDVYDLSVSADGKYLVATNKTHLFYYSIEGLSLLWTFYPNQTFNEYIEILDVAMSPDGEYVVAGYGEKNYMISGGLSYFNESTSRSGLQDNATWTNWYEKEGGAVERACMDISDNGEYVTVAGTGDKIYYFTDCRSRTGEITNAYDWRSQSVWYPGELVCLDMTPDGRYIAVGGYNNTQYYVAYYDNDTVTVTTAISTIYDVKPLWEVQRNATGRTMDIAISDDGFGVVAGYKYNATSSYYGVAYWNNSHSLSNSPDPTWYYEEAISLQPVNVSVAISNSGDKVTGGSILQDAYGELYFWTDFGGLSETPTILEPNWTEPCEVTDVAMSGDGGVIAAITNEANVNVFNSADSNELGYYELDSPGEIISISEDGKIVAAGTSGTYTTYVVKTLDPITWPNWEEEATVYTDPSPDASADEEDMTVCYVSDDGTYLYFRIELTEALQEEEALISRIYLDIDQDQMTGLSGEEDGAPISLHDIGADWKIEDWKNWDETGLDEADLFKYSGDIVTWEFIANVLVEYDSTYVNIRVPLSDLENPTFPIDILFVTSLWTPGTDYNPDEGHITYGSITSAPVGGEVAPLSFVLIASWAVLALTALAIGYTISRRKLLLN